MIIQFCGLSGSGKSTLANKVKLSLQPQQIPVEVLDGDIYRKYLNADLGFSKEDRNTNIRRLAFVASRLSSYGVVPIICAINPYADVRQEIAESYPEVKTVYIQCGLQTLLDRDTKGLYAKAALPPGHPARVNNLSGVNDPLRSLKPRILYFAQILKVCRNVL